MVLLLRKLCSFDQLTWVLMVDIVGIDVYVAPLVSEISYFDQKSSTDMMCRLSEIS